MRPSVLLGLFRDAERVAERLLLERDLEFITVHEDTAAEFAALRIPHRPLTAFLPETVMDPLIAEARARAEYIVRELHQDAFRRQYLRFDEQTWLRLQALLIQSIEKRFARALVLTEAMYRCSAQCDLRAVLVSTDYFPDDKALVLAARRLGVPSIHLLHGFPYGATNAHDEINADIVAVFSERAKDVYLRYGQEPEHIVITGNPEWDLYAGPLHEQSREAVCAAWNLDPARPIILYGLTMPHRFSSDSVRQQDYHIVTASHVLRALKQLADKHPDWQYLIRPHPGDAAAQIPVIEALLAEIGLQNVPIDQRHPRYGISIAECVLCTNSNLGIQAMLAGVPVVDVGLDEAGRAVIDEGLGPLFREGDAVMFARTADEIAPAIEAAMTDAATRARLDTLRGDSVRAFNYANDGRGLERFCALVLDVVDRSDDHARGVNRYPETEPALARAVPEAARSVLVVGRAAAYAVRAIRAVHAQVTVQGATSFTEVEAAHADVVVLCDPIDDSSTCEQLLRDAAQIAGDDGRVVALFTRGDGAVVAEALRSGHWSPARTKGEAPVPMGGFTRNGVAIALSRALRDAQTIAPCEDDALSWESRAGWVACAVKHRPQQSALARDAAERKTLADESNARGEKAYASGDLVGAANAFAEAIRTCSSEPRYFSNLAVALHALDKSDDAWAMLIEALALDPSMQLARDNLRMIGATLGKETEANELLALFGRDA